MYFQIKEHNLGQTLDKNNNNKNVENNFIALFSNVVYFFQMKLSFQDSGKFLYKNSCHYQYQVRLSSVN